MAVEITLKGVPGTNEYRAGEKLKSILKSGIGNRANGRVVIKANATLIGTEVKDIDLLVIGVFDPDYRLEALLLTRYYDPGLKIVVEEPPKRRNVRFNSFCFCIELKSHPAEDIRVEGTDVFVPYDQKLSNVTYQSERQKQSVRFFLESRISEGFFVSNLIWLENVSRSQLSELLGANAIETHTHNILPSNFNAFDLLQLLIMQRPPVANKYGFYSSAIPKDDGLLLIKKVEDALDLFEKVRKNVGKLTRQQLERITTRLLDEQKYAQEIGNKIVIFSGRAGTGKTVKLLRVAFDLASNHSKRCLVLTYNHALASDMRRTIHLSGISDGYEVSTVSVTTLDSFFYQLLTSLGLLRDKFGYADNRDRHIIDLWEYLEAGVLTDADLNRLAAPQLNWNYVLVDEGQDWRLEEKNILFRLFGSKHLIVADGLDQMIRGSKKCDWSDGVDAYKPPAEKRCLRQKRNLANFVNAYAEKMYLNWKLEPREEFPGGKIVVVVGEYSPEIHKPLYASCVESGNLAYEMLVLVPPNLVVKKLDSEPNLQTETETSSSNRIFRDGRRSLLLDRFVDSGVKFWDGTNRDIRQEYPVDLEEHRLLQYDSCRGLEGWVVVCVEFDNFIKYKIDTFKPEENEQASLGLFSPKEKAQQFAHLWSLIPLTRAIDTLVITLADGNSHVAHVLRELHDEFPDYVEWRE